MTWIPSEHSDQDNLQWSWLRAIEWGRYPIFLSQSIAPILLIWLPWLSVVTGVFVLNLAWALFVRYNFVSVSAAYVGALIVHHRWLTWIAATTFMFTQGRTPECWVALAWPVLIFPLGIFTPTRIGSIQDQFMRSLGYERSETNMQ